MSTLLDEIAPRSVLDDIVEKIVYVMRRADRAHGLPPSVIVVRQMVRRLVRDELHRYAVDPNEGIDFLERVEDAICIEPERVEVILGSGYWQRRLMATGMTDRLDYAPELLSTAAIVVSDVVCAELRGH